MSDQNSKEKAVLVLDPKSELHFKGPFTEVVTSQLRLTNPSNRKICFKVKTTAPKRYCVRPNNGIIEAKGTAIIAVMLQPFDVESQATEKNKHKFMVQTMFVPDEADVNQDTLWKEAGPDAINDAKLKCVFDYVPRGTSGGSAAMNNSPELNNLQQQPSSQNSNWSAYGSPVSSTTAPSVPPPASPAKNDLHESHAPAAVDDLNRGRNVINHNNSDRNSSSQSSNPNPVARNTESASPAIIQKVSNVNDNSPSGDKKVLEENRRLRDELTQIRQENMQLKEEGLKQRIRLGESPGGNRGQTGPTGHVTSGDLLAQQKMAGKLGGSGEFGSQQEIQQLLLNPNVLALGLVLFILGLVVGKVIF